jgi:hypothetical protein
MSVDAALPQLLFAEISQRYADVLRVGSIKLNGVEVCWSTMGSTDEQLEAFSSAFRHSLRQLPEVYGLEDTTLSQATYWFCKVVSINYALSYVLDAVKAKFGDGCCIRTSDSAGRTLVEYTVEVLPNHTMRVRMGWREKGNIMYCDPRTARKKLKGTLSSLVTDFSLPPDPGFSPTYHLYMKVKRSYKQKLFSKVSGLMRRSRKSNQDETLVLDSPLHACSKLSMESTSCSACSTEAPPSFHSDDLSFVGDLPRENSMESSDSVPLHMCVAGRSVEIHGHASTPSVTSEVFCQEILV